MPHTICVFNVNNLYARYRFGRTFPGDVAGKSAVNDPHCGYAPMYEPSAFELFGPEQRALAALAITRGDDRYPDVICLVEVESMVALRLFAEHHLAEGGYSRAVLIDGRDLRRINVGVLSRLDIVGIRTHIDDRDPDAPPGTGWVFSRDCLEVDLALGPAGDRRLTLFVNHFKSKYAENAEESRRADAARLRQATAVRHIVSRRFPDAATDQSLFAVVGDLNDTPDSPCLAPLFETPLLVDAMARVPAPQDRWTEWHRGANEVSQLDHVLLSPALDHATAGCVPVIERRAIGFERTLVDGRTGPRHTHWKAHAAAASGSEVDFQFPRFSDVTPSWAASDHSPVFFEVP